MVVVMIVVVRDQSVVGFCVPLSPLISLSFLLNELNVTPLKPLNYLFVP